MTDEELIEKLKAGDSACFGILIELHSQKVLNIAFNIVRNLEDAEDITQEVFIEIFQSIQHFKRESKLSTWVYKITVNKSLDFLRKKKRKKRFGILQQLFSADSAEPRISIRNELHPGIELENKERASILQDAIEQLPEKQKTAFVLNKIEDQSYAEVANIMDMSIASVESLLFRAKQNLQKLLGDYYEKNEK